MPAPPDVARSRLVYDEKKGENQQISQIPKFLAFFVIITADSA